jgi:hypothetical protein
MDRQHKKDLYRAGASGGKASKKGKKKPSKPRKKGSKKGKGKGKGKAKMEPVGAFGSYQQMDEYLGAKSSSKRALAPTLNNGLFSLSGEMAANSLMKGIMQNYYRDKDVDAISNVALAQGAIQGVAPDQAVSQEVRSLYA